VEAQSPISNIFHNKLIGAVWTFGRQGSPPTGSVVFDETGFIENAAFPEQFMWRLAGPSLEIFDRNGKVILASTERYMDGHALCILLQGLADADTRFILREAGQKADFVNVAPSPQAAPDQDAKKITPEIEAPMADAAPNLSTAFQGHINQFLPPGKIIGWAMNTAARETDKLDVTARLGTVILGRCKADQFRADLAQFGSGKYMFELTCERSIPYYAVLNGDLKIELSFGGKTMGALQFDQITKNIVSVLEIGRLLNEIATLDSTNLKITLGHATAHIAEPAASAVQSALTIVKNRDKIPSFSKYEPGSISSVAFKTGIISSDRAAILGQDGHIFLIEGNNNVAEIFSKQHGSKSVTQTAERWINLIETRAKLLGSFGGKFIQIIVPEKLSIMRELFDGKMAAPSAALTALELEVSKLVPNVSYISGLGVLSQLPFGTPFMKTDSHLTPEGAFAIFKAICAKLGIIVNQTIQFDVPIVTQGDLGKRFFGHELYEVCYAAKEPSFKSGLKTISSHNPSGGGHVGRRVVYQNEQAPIRKKVVLFGNSFSGINVFQGLISYWLAAWFQEYHFIFSPDLDIQYVTAEKPDVVICQTIERFLETVPAY
jgi:hypothetical protein